MALRARGFRIKGQWHTVDPGWTLTLIRRRLVEY